MDKTKNMQWHLSMHQVICLKDENQQRYREHFGPQSGASIWSSSLAQSKQEIILARIHPDETNANTHLCTFPNIKQPSTTNKICLLNVASRALGRKVPSLPVKP
jgi:hypothetical protein